MIPNTIEEAFVELHKLSSVGFFSSKTTSYDWNKWLAIEEDDAIAFSHHSIGQWIRNEWELWGGYGELKKWFIANEIKHPDDMSAIILRSYHRFKNNKDMNIEEQIEETVQYYLSDKEKLMRERKKKINELSNEENNC